MYSSILSLSILYFLMSFSSTILYVVFVDLNKSSFQKKKCGRSGLYRGYTTGIRIMFGMILDV